MIKDYSEITATLDKKLDSMNAAFADKKFDAAAAILADINEDLKKLIEWLKNRGTL
jgi:hypothetical protein